MKVITALVDFTDTAKLATQYACWLAKKYQARINLLHITPELDYNPKLIERKMVDFTGVESCGLEYSLSVGDGDFQEKIPRLLELSQSDLVVIGTHGARGIFATTFGAEVVKLTQRIDLSALVIQDHSPQPDSFKLGLFPIGPHDNFVRKIDTAISWAKLGLRYNVFALSRNGGQMDETIERNLKLTKEKFDAAGVNYEVEITDTEVYSVGYATDILRQAEAVKADLILSMSNPSEENSYFGNVDKTNVVLNAKGIPVLCVSD